MEPPAAAAYAVLPVGVDIIRPGNENEFDKGMNKVRSIQRRNYYGCRPCFGHFKYR